MAKSGRKTQGRVKAAVRKPASRPRPPAAGPVSAPAARKTTAKARRAAHPRSEAPQRFAVSHLTEDAFDSGLRSYAQYRDLGMRAATGGLVQAHVIRFVPPCRPEEVSKLHYHDVELQMIYVLKGWIKSEFAGQGTHTLNAGACWLQPPRIQHRVLDYSDDCEVLEIVLPADFDTVTLD